MAKRHTTGVRERDDQQFQKNIDAMLLGASPETLAAQSDLSYEEQQTLALAHRLAHAQLAERSAIRSALKDELMRQMQARQEIQQIMEQRETLKKSSAIPRLMLFGLIGLVVVGITLVGMGVLIFARPPAVPSIPVGANVIIEPTVAPPGELYPDSIERIDPVYTMQNVVFGDLFQLAEVIVQTDRFDYSVIESVTLIWHTTQPIENGRYMVTFTTPVFDDKLDIGDSVVIFLPTETLTAFSTRHDLFYIPEFEEDFETGGDSVFYLTVTDTQTGEPLRLSDGSDSLPLRLIPASVIPPALVPGNQPSGEMPTPAPPATPTPGM